MMALAGECKTNFVKKVVILLDPLDNGATQACTHTHKTYTEVKKNKFFLVTADTSDRRVRHWPRRIGTSGGTVAAPSLSELFFFFFNIHL